MPCANRISSLATKDKYKQIHYSDVNQAKDSRACNSLAALHHHTQQDVLVSELKSWATQARLPHAAIMMKL
jgi:hypothetical protein